MLINNESYFKSDDTRLVPEIRFKGYTDAWGQRKLGDLADRYDNLRIPITASQRISGHTPYYGANGIQDYVDGFTHDGEFILVAEDGANDIENYPVQYVNGRIWVNNHAHVLQAKSKIADNKFLMYRIQRTNIEPYLVGSGRAKLNADVMMRIGFLVPKLTEQIAIGSFFRTLDTTITLHQRKLEGLRELKKGYLQQMFPQVGERVPRVRFKDFNGEWTERRLGDVAEFNPRSELPDVFEYVDLESVVGTTLVTHRTENKDTSPSRAQRLARKGDVFFQTVRPYQQNNYLFDLPSDNYVFSTGYAQLRPIIDKRFLFCLLQEKRFLAEVLDNCTGTSYPAINSTTLSEISIAVALESKEQAAIGGFFRLLDEQIADQQTKLSHIKRLKSAYLQKMFI